MVSTERVATIAVCPNCRAQLGVPARAPADAELQCPRCETRFAVTPEVIQELPLALVAEEAAALAYEEHNEVEDAVIAGLHFDMPSAPVIGDHNLDVTPAARAPRRRASPLGTLVGIVGGGAGGLLLAGYALLWITDPPLDLFRMGEWLPEGMLPRAMQAADEDAAFDEWAEEAEEAPAEESPAEEADAAASDADAPRADVPEN